MTVFLLPTVASDGWKRLKEEEREQLELSWKRESSCWSPLTARMQTSKDNDEVNRMGVGGLLSDIMKTHLQRTT